MGKIPKNLSDKDMLRDYQEEPTLEEAFARREEAARDDERRVAAEPTADIRVAYLTPDIIGELGRELLALKMELFNEGVREYHMRLKREGKNIVLFPVVPEK